MYSEKATKFCKIFSLLLSYVVPVKSKVMVLQTFVAFIWTLMEFFCENNKQRPKISTNLKLLYEEPYT